MAEKRDRPEVPVATDDPHPVEPAEGAPEPGEDADADLPPHPDEPAEGQRR